MANNDKQKEQQQKDIVDRKRDTRVLIDFSNEYLAGRFDEDAFIDAISSQVGKLKKGKKPKKVKETDDYVLEINVPISDFHLSYLQGVVNQVFKDTVLRINIKV